MRLSSKRRKQQSGRSAAWQRTTLGWWGSQVQILSFRPFKKKHLFIKGVFLFKTFGFEPLKCAGVLLNHKGLKCPVLSDQSKKPFTKKGVFLFKTFGFEPLKCAGVLLNRKGLKCPVLSDHLRKNTFYPKKVFFFLNQTLLHPAFINQLKNNTAHITD